MERDFDIVEHTSDIGIIAYGTDIGRAFINAARALFSIITDPAGIWETDYRDIEVTAEDREDLLVEWLNELIYLFDAEQMLFSKFVITYLTDTQMVARCYGEKIDTARHALKTGVKAATYHMLKIEKDDVFRVQVLFDV